MDGLRQRRARVANKPSAQVAEPDAAGLEGPTLRALLYQRVPSRKEPGSLARALREAEPKTLANWTEVVLPARCQPVGPLAVRDRPPSFTSSRYQPPPEMGTSLIM